MLDILAKNKISNPIILITKCLIPNDFVDYLSNLVKNGMRLVVYLSYSGLSRFYEPNINHENIKINFRNLASKGIKIIHYYRPFIPENSDAKSIAETLDFVKDYTNISVTTGLKLKSDFIDKIDFWNITSTAKEKCLNASGVWPKTAYDYLFGETKPNQNIFQSNTCALAQTLEVPSPQYYGTHECKHCNNCSEEQKRRCAAFKKNAPTIDDLKKQLNKLGKYNETIEIFQNEHAIIIKNSELTTGDCAYLSYVLGIKVTIEKKREDDNYFNSPFTNTDAYIVK
jgi:DNA polymerase III delta prime subunit